MAYSSRIAQLLTEQLVRFSTLNRHQLAGHVANLEFWLAEVRHCLAVIDGYHARFEQLRAAQAKYAAEHQTRVYELPNAAYPWDDRERLPQPTRVPDSELHEAKRSLRDATYHFLIRCYRDAFIEEEALRQHCNSLDIGVEAKDLKRRSRT